MLVDRNFNQVYHYIDNEHKHGFGLSYKRKIYLINPSFQLRIALIVCVITLISSIIYPWTIFDLIGTFTDFLSVRFPQEAKGLDNKKLELIIFLSLWQIGFLGLIFLTCIFITHKIAGPLFKLKKFLKEITQGSEINELYFRKGDYFHDVAQSVNDTFKYLQNKRDEDFVSLSEIKSYISNLSAVLPEDKKVILLEINKKINEIETRY